MNTNQVSFITGCREFFGLHTGQTPMEFGKDVLKLSNADRKEIAVGLIQNGINIDPATIEGKNAK